MGQNLGLDGECGTFFCGPTKRPRAIIFFLKGRLTVMMERKENRKVLAYLDPEVLTWI